MRIMGLVRLESATNPKTVMTNETRDAPQQPLKNQKAQQTRKMFQLSMVPKYKRKAEMLETQTYRPNSKSKFKNESVRDWQKKKRRDRIDCSRKPRENF